MTIGQWLLAALTLAAVNGVIRWIVRELRGRAPNIPIGTPAVQREAMMNRIRSYSLNRLSEMRGDESLSIEARAMAEAELRRRSADIADL